MVNGMPLNISIYDPERAEEEEGEKGSEEEVGSQEEKGDIEGEREGGGDKGEDEKTPPSPFMLPLPLIISPESPLSELKAAVLKKAGWDHSLYIVRMAQDSPEVLLSPTQSDLSSTLEELHITAGDQIFVELVDEKVEGEEESCTVMGYFEEFANKISVSVNCIFLGRGEERKGEV